MRVLFTDCVELVGSACRPFEGTKKYVSTGAVDTDHIVEANTEVVEYSRKPTRANLEVEAGAILFAKMQATEKTLMIDSVLANNIYSTGFCAVRAKEGVLTDRCLYHLLRSDVFLLQKDKQCSGATQKAISNRGLAKIEISLPVFCEQDRIASQLDAVMGLVARRQKEMAALDDLIKSRFVEMFGDLRDNKYRMPIEAMENVTIGINDGEHGKVERAKDGPFFLSARNISGGVLDYETAAHVTQAEFERISKRFNPTPGDVVLTCAGTIGRAAIVGDVPFVSDRDVALIKPDRDKVLSEYLLAYFQSDDALEQMGQLTHAATIAHLYLGKIKSMRLLIPPMEKQREFASFVAQVDKSKFAVRQAIEQLETLKASLMQEYFG